MRFWQQLGVVAVAMAMFSSPARAGEEVLLGGGYPGLTNLRGMIVKSTDGGKTWKETWYKDKDGHTIFNIVQVKELKKVFALGRAGILSSANGDSWTEAKLADNLKEVYDLAYGNGMLVAVGPGTNFLYSTDAGETWQSITCDAAGKYVNEKFKEWNDKIGPVGKRHYYAVEFIDGKFIATGSAVAAIVLEPKDGKLELVSETKHEDFFSFARGIATDGADTVYLFSQYKTYRSNDKGKTWESARKLKPLDLSGGGAYGNKTWVAGGGFTTIAYSKDGKSWEKAEVPGGRMDKFHKITFGHGKFYAAKTEKAFLVSSDGVKWTSVEGKHHPDNEEQYDLRFYVVRPIE